MTRTPVAATLCLALAGCAGDDKAEPTEPSETTIDCGSDYDDYVDGLIAEGPTYDVRFVSASPSPPDRGDNLWTIEVLDATGPRDDLTVDVEPFMPEHGHGTSPSTFPGSAAGGTYTFEPIDLFMPGLWVITFNVDDGQKVEPIAFRFCLEG